MTTNVYARVFYWYGKNGEAKAGNVHVRLDTLPPGVPAAARIDYGEVSFGVRAFGQIQPAEGQGEREMEAPELSAVRTWLDGLLACVTPHLSGVKP